MNQSAASVQSAGSARFDPLTFRAGRRRLKLLGWIVLWGGFLLMTSDFTTGFPTPLTGPRVLIIWGPVLAFGVWLLVQGYRIPFREVLLLADAHGHRLDVPTIMRELYVSPAVAEHILDSAVKRFGHKVVTVAPDPETKVKIYTFYPPL